MITHKDYNPSSFSSSALAGKASPLARRIMTLMPTNKEVHTGIMIAFYVPKTEAQMIANQVQEQNLPGALPAKELHLTLCFAGTTDKPPCSKEELQAVLSQFVVNRPSLHGRVSGIGLFNPSADDGGQPFYASFDSPELPNFRQDLLDQLKRSNIPIAQNHGFTPHITLAYLPLSYPLPTVRIAEMPLQFRQLILKWGDETIEFPIGTYKETRNPFDAQVARVMRKYKKRMLHSGQGKNKGNPPKGKIVTSREQAIAIALSEAKKRFGARQSVKELITEKAYKVLIGKRGGKYYFTKTGKKKYGTPPALMREDRATRTNALKKYLETATPEQIAKTRSQLEGKLADAKAKGDKEGVIKARASLAVLPKDKKVKPEKAIAAKPANQFENLKPNESMPLGTLEADFRGNKVASEWRVKRVASTGDKNAAPIYRLEKNTGEGWENGGALGDKEIIEQAFTQVIAETANNPRFTNFTPKLDYDLTPYKESKKPKAGSQVPIPANISKPEQDRAIRRRNQVEAQKPPEVDGKQQALEKSQKVYYSIPKEGALAFYSPEKRKALLAKLDKQMLENRNADIYDPSLASARNRIIQKITELDAKKKPKLPEGQAPLFTKIPRKDKKVSAAKPEKAPPRVAEPVSPALNDLKQGEHANMGTIEGIAPNGENRKIAWRTRRATPEEEIQFKRYAPTNEFNKPTFIMERQTNGRDWQNDFAGNQEDLENSFQNSVNNLSSRLDGAKTNIKYDLAPVKTRQEQAKKVAEINKRKKDLEKQVDDLQKQFESDFKRAQSGYGLKFEEALKKNKLWAEFKKNGSNSPKFPQIKEALAKEFNAYKKEVDEKVAKAQDELKTIEDSLAQTAKEHTRPTFTVFKEAKTGKYRWLTFSSTAYKDRDGEIVTTKALEDAVDEMNSTGNFGTLRFWHVPHADIGTCDTSVLVGRVLVESGTFHETRIAEKFKSYREPLGTSTGFKHTHDQPDTNGHYHKIHIFERSVLPLGSASNLFTRFAVN